MPKPSTGIPMKIRNQPPFHFPRAPLSLSLLFTYLMSRLFQPHTTKTIPIVFRSKIFLSVASSFLFYLRPRNTGFHPSFYRPTVNRNITPARKKNPFLLSPSTVMNFSLYILFSVFDSGQRLEFQTRLLNPLRFKPSFYRKYNFPHLNITF